MTTYKVGQVLTNPIDKKTRTLLFNDQLVWFFKTDYGLHVKYGWCYESNLISQGWTPQEEECSCPKNLSPSYVHFHFKDCEIYGVKDKPQIEELGVIKEKYLLEDVPVEIFNMKLKINEIIRYLNK